MPPTELGLAQRWRDEAALLRRRAASPQAEVLESCAAELEAWARERELQALTLDQAAAESGYTYSAIEKMVRRGEPSRMWEGGVHHESVDVTCHAGRLRRGREFAPDLAARVLG